MAWERLHRVLSKLFAISGFVMKCGSEPEPGWCAWVWGKGQELRTSAEVHNLIKPGSHSSLVEKKPYTCPD